MPTARESLLDAAHAALARDHWSSIRMVRVASDAGVSRQTLYNEFGDKSGLAAALAARQLATLTAAVANCLHDTALTSEDATLRALTATIVSAGQGDKLLRSALTGCYCEGAPQPPRQPARLLALLRDQAARLLAERWRLPADQSAERCEIAIRLAVSYLVVPGPPGTERAAPSGSPPAAVTATGPTGAPAGTPLPAQRRPAGR